MKTLGRSWCLGLQSHTQPDQAVSTISVGGVLVSNKVIELTLIRSTGVLNTEFVFSTTPRYLLFPDCILRRNRNTEHGLRDSKRAKF